MDRLSALVFLRWKLELRALARAKERAVGLLLLVPMLAMGSIFAIVFVFIGARALEAAHPELVLPVISAAATAVGLLWALSPILTGVAFAETHDMSRLVHFPVPLPTLVASSILANLAQPLVLVRLPVLVALAAAISSHATHFPAALAGVLLTFAFMLTADQVAGLVLHGVSRNRRLHDLALFVGLGLGFLLSVAPVLLIAGGARRTGFLVKLLLDRDVCVVSPFAWGVRAAVHGGRGEPLPFLAFGAAGFAALAAALWLATVLMRRIYAGELDLGGWAGSSTSRARMRLPGAVGALLEKDLRAAWRDPSLKAALVLGLVGPLLLLFFFSRMGAGSRSSGALFLLASFVGISGFGANAFGSERRGIQLLMGFPIERWKILLSKNLAAMALRLPGFLMLLVAGAWVAPTALLPALATVTLVTFTIAASIDNYMSILFPVTLPAPGASPHSGSAAGGRGLGAAVLGALLLGVALVAASPFAFLAWLPLLLDKRWLWGLSLPLALAGACAVYAMLVGGAARLLSRREPELLERVLGEA